MGILTYDKDHFLMDGKHYQIISGAIHYFRVHPDYWEDRLKKLKACGFNTVETYTCWNLHERKEGQFDFSGILDIERFIEIAEKLGLNVIVRPGPYICAEWEFGGLPSWLLSYPDMAIRCNDPLFLEKVTPYYQELLSRLRPHLCTNGGKIIMMQVENEYGSYGDDHDYVRNTMRLYQENGIDCLLFTSDGDALSMLSGGTLPELLAVCNFGSRATERFKILKDFKPDQPVMCGEFWCGWFDHWYEDHKTRSAEEVAAELQQFFDANGSFNFYMFHGGTNFGFWNGANHHELYEPTITSYDYCAPLSEAGDMTDMYFAIKECIEKNTGNPAPQLHVQNSPKAAYGTVALTQSAPLFENLTNLSTPVFKAYPQTMEQLGQDFGYLLYATEIQGPCESMDLIFTELHDRAHIFVNGSLAGIRERTRRNDEVKVGAAFGETVKIDILVENMGRINYGPLMFDKKGILGGIRIGHRFHFGWNHFPMTMDDLSQIRWKNEAVTGAVPAFFRGSFTIDGNPCDTFIKPEGFKKGFIVINGFNIGRYYNDAGPQKTLYVPAPVLKEGDNEIIIFETDGCCNAEVTFVDQPELCKPDSSSAALKYWG